MSMIPENPEVSVGRNYPTLENLLGHDGAVWVRSCLEIGLEEPRITGTGLKIRKGKVYQNGN